ncbi:hypothetical protein HZS_5063 [Henneguya salminicola]|nr:hypothetical protein HZS_5063 [Henneguya salminicola]
MRQCRHDSSDSTEDNCRSDKISPIQRQILKESELNETVAAYQNEGRKKSLIELNNEKRKNLKQEGHLDKRKPFDRDTDLNIVKPGFSDTKKLSTDAVRSLVSRFSSAKDKKCI